MRFFYVYQFMVGVIVVHYARRVSFGTVFQLGYVRRPTIERVVGGLQFTKGDYHVQSINPCIRRSNQ